MHNDLSGHQGEAEGAKERKPKHLPFLHELILCCVKSFSQEEKKRKEKRERGEELKNSQRDTRKGVETGAVVDEVGPRTSKKSSCLHSKKY